MRWCSNNTDSNSIPHGITSCRGIIRDPESPYRIMWPSACAYSTQRTFWETKLALQLRASILEIIWDWCKFHKVVTLPIEFRAFLPALFTRRVTLKRSIQFIQDLSYITSSFTFAPFHSWVSRFENTASFAIEIVRETMKTGLAVRYLCCFQVEWYLDSEEEKL